MRSSSPPPAPDPVVTAQAQAGANKEAILESAKVNQISEVTPYGSIGYYGEVGSPDRTKVTSLSPTAQRQFDQQNQIAEVLGSMALNQSQYLPTDKFQIEGATPLPSDFSADAERTQQATYDRAMNLMRPEWDRQERALEQRLANQGLPAGSEAYTDAYQPFYQGRKEAEIAAAMDAIRAGGAEQSRLYGLSADARGRQINEQLMERSQPINELAALLQGSPAIGTPQGGNQAQYQIAPPDVMGAYHTQYGGQMNAYNQKVSTNNANMGAAAGVATAAMMVF